MTTLMEFNPHPLVHALGWTLLHFLWQGTLAALVLWLVLGFLGGRSSQARYGAACFALVLMAAMPMITFGRIESAEYKTRPEIQQPAIAIDSGILVTVGIGETAPSWPIKMAIALDRLVPWLLAAWFVGAIFFVVRLNFGLIVARRLKHAATQAPSYELQHLFDELKLRLGIVRAVRLLHSARVQVPTVIGWLRPVVLIPASCLTGLSTLQIEAIFCHELAHVRRHDYLVSVLQSVAEALLFYHPAVWWVSKQVRRERECCCDEIAIGHGGDVLAYAKALSYLEERRATLPEFVLGANGGVLTMRIKRLLGCRQDAQASQFAAFTLVALIVAVAGSYVATVARAQPKSAQPAPMSIVASSSAQPQATGLPQQKTDRGSAETQPLQPEYKNWVDEDVIYTITPEERTAYLGLPNNEDRDKFIENFWERRNPNPGSAVNSSKEQYYARIAYANQHFAADIPGWKTDRGRAYIVNGKPESVDAHPTGGQSANGAGIMPFEVWHYPSAAGAGQRIDLKFVDDCQCGKYRLVSKTPAPRTLAGINTAGDAGGPATPAGPVRVSAGTMAGSDSKGVPDPVAMQEVGGSAPAVAVAPESPIRVSGGVVSGMLVSRVDPVYPPEAKAAGVQGAVVLHVIVAKDGTVASLQAVSGPPQLTQSAMDAVRQWTYKPYLLNGEPVDVQTTITVNYSLGDSTMAQGQSAVPDPPSRLADGTTMPVLTSQVEPEYTKSARKAKTSGTVMVNLTVDEQGRPQNVHVVHGIGNGLDKKALEAVKQYKFKPATQGGKPVPVSLNIEVNFQIF